MSVNIRQLATQIYIQAVSPRIMENALYGPGLDKLFKEAAGNSIAAAEEFARAYERQASLPAMRVA